MGFSANKNISINLEILYQQGDVLFCPICKREHYRVLKPIYKNDHMTPSQVEAIDPEVLNPAFDIRERCQFCFGGNAVGLVQKIEGRALK